MSALLIVSYDVPDPDRYAEYNPGSLEAVMATVGKHGGQPVAAGPPDVVMGSMENTVVCISFPDGNAAKAWLDDHEYARTGPSATRCPGFLGCWCGCCLCVGWCSDCGCGVALEDLVFECGAVVADVDADVVEYVA